MNRICVCDLDGVICDSTARFAKAEEAKAAYLEQEGMAVDDNAHSLVSYNGKMYLESDLRRANDIYWKTAFTPALVSLDTLIDGVPQAIEQIRLTHGYDVVLLTSRPESMREATEQWLDQHEIWTDNAFAVANWLIMKPSSQQFVKTTVWKAGIVQMLASLYDARTILYIDDEVANHEELSKHASSLWMVYLAKSLQEVITLIS